MRLYTDPDIAESLGPQRYYLPCYCPYTTGSEDVISRLCGNWCPHFHQISNGTVVSLSCGGQECIIRVEK